MQEVPVLHDKVHLLFRSLSTFLQQSEGASDSSQLSLKVPLLGNLNIRHNTNISQIPITQPLTPILPGNGLWNAGLPQFLTAIRERLTESRTTTSATYYAGANDLAIEPTFVVHRG